MPSQPNGKLDGRALDVLVRLLHDAVGLVDHRGRLLLTNRAEELPVAKAPPVRMTDLGDVFHIFHPDGRPYETEEWPALRSLKSGEAIADEEFFRLAEDGSRRTFSCNSAPVLDDQGRVGGAVLVAREITEQKRSREQLRYLLPMLDHSEDGIIGFDAEWHVTAWNKGAERMYGWSSEQVLGHVLPNIIRAAVSDEERLAIRQETARRGRRRSELTVERKDGSVLSVEAIVVAIRDEHGQITGYLAIHRDITERKRADKALREAQRRTEAVLESISDTFFALDREWRYTYVNERAVAQARKAWGRDVRAGDLLGKNCWELFPEQLGSTMDRELHRALREQEVVEFQTYSALSDAWLEVRAYPSQDGLSVYSRDITARKLAHEELANHASLLDNVEEAVVATDAEDFCITAWNRGAERLYGYSAGEVLGRPAREVASLPGDQSRLKLEQGLLEKQRARIEFEARRKDGSLVVVELVAVAVKDNQGEITGYLGIHRDITERKRADEQLAYHASLLENMDDAVLATDPDSVVTAWNRGAHRMFDWSAGEALGHTVDELIGTDRPEAEFSARLRHLSEDRTARTEGTWYGKGRRPAYAESHVIVLRGGDDRITGYLSILRDTSERRRYRQELERRVRQQAAVAELGLKALEDGRVGPLMDEAASLVSRMLGVEYAKVDELLPGGDQLLVRAGVGWPEGVVGSRTLPTGRGSPAGYALWSREPVIVDDPDAETRFEMPALLREHQVMSDITVVIDPRGNPFGTLAAMSKNRRTFSEDDVDFVQAVANVLATAVERARADDRLEEVRETERSRIARDLHDEGLRELTEALARATVSRSTQTGRRDEQRWTELITSLQRVGQQLRGAIYDLRLSTQEDRTFGDLLADMIAIEAEMPGASKIELHGLEASPARPLGHPGSEVLRIVREAITNARRHSGAGTVRIDVGESSEDALHVEISDDGEWPDRRATLESRPGTGITSMIERAELLGTELQIEDRPGGGTRVWLDLTL